MSDFDFSFGFSYAPNPLLLISEYLEQLLICMIKLNFN